MASQVLKERYAIQQQFGKNAGRRTLLARDLQTQELVVIKLLIFGEDFQWDDVKLFDREAQTLQLLSHPAIPRYLDYFDIDTPMGKGFALVQSYIPAKSLEQWLKSGRTFSEEEIKQLAKALLEILRYLHGQQQQVIHRDIKPSNILLSDRSGNSVGQVYLVDFGSVQTLAAKKGSTITVVGTYGYMPPEQFGGRTVPASDLYSLGATLIYLVTGRHPAELSQDNLRIQFESAVNLSPDLIDWLKWMVEPSLNRRLASAEEALKAFEHPRQKTEIYRFREKPLGSRIQLNKNGEIIEILIPPRRLSFWSVVGAGAAISFFLGLTLLPLIWIETVIKGQLEFILPMVIFFLVFSLPFGGVSLLIVYAILANFFRTTRLHLNPKNILLTYEWPWGNRQEAPILKKDIKKLVSTQRSWITTKSSKGGTSSRFINPKLTIFAAKQKYELAVNETLTDPEIDWLAHKLSEWSGVPITVKDARQDKERLQELLKGNRSSKDRP